MSTPDQVTEVREMLGETDTTNTLFTDERIMVWIDDSDSLEAAALVGWQRKAAHWAGLVNVTDGAAARAFSDLFDHAQNMIKFYTKLASPVAGRTRIGKIVRS